MTGEWRMILAIQAFIAATLSGCTTVAISREAGFAEVSRTVENRAGRQISWNQEPANDTASREAVGQLLAKGLTAKSAIDIALLNNHVLKATYADLGLAQSDVVQASLLHNPVLDAAAGIPITSGSVDLTFSVAMDVIDLLYVPLRKRVAGAAFEETKLRVAGEVLDLAWRAEAAFYRHQANEQLLELRGRIAKSTAASYEVAARLRAAGNTTELEVDRERAMAEEAKLDLRSAEIATRESREHLNALLGLWGEQANWTTGSNRLPDPPAEPLDVERLESRAIERSLDLAAAEQHVVAAAENLTLNRTSGWFPELTAGAKGERDEGDWDLGPSLAIPLPLFDRGQARLARARAELGRAEELRYALAVGIRASLRAARDRAVGERERALFYRDVQLPLRERVVRETELQYNAMQLGVFELLRAKEQQIESASRYVETLRDYWLAHGDLTLILSGRLPPGDSRPPPQERFEELPRLPFPTLR
jgi:outer membrane protein, heavy metal efflux system